ncbi:hypothetical protein PGTUg99_007176 [Puccinia graminis f. sp. tritici]|uniref:Uncharacterized protein n=1 Tax=Puccinia graminis f. sp. tritici TaxID=56615 RepID=A0A5B0RWQ2_PUCGR|nr:hypothetical protein PGTUg99_007176 [Puccinia graminis f. sp. tritici]
MSSRSTGLWLAVLQASSKEYGCDTSLGCLARFTKEPLGQFDLSRRIHIGLLLELLVGFFIILTAKTIYRINFVRGPGVISWIACKFYSPEPQNIT